MYTTITRSYLLHISSYCTQKLQFVFCAFTRMAKQLLSISGILHCPVIITATCLPPQQASATTVNFSHTA